MNKKKIEKPLYQKLIEIVGFGLIGIFFFGQIIAAFNNSKKLFTRFDRIGLTVFIFTSFLLTVIYLKNNRIKWVAKSNEIVYISRLGKKSWAIFLGVVFLLWLPPFCNKNSFINKEKSKKLNTPIFDGEKDSKFNVLILSFFNPNHEDGTKCVGQSISYGLNSIIDEYSLNANIVYTDTISTPEYSSKANSIREFHNADFLIYGLSSRIGNSCENLKICFRYSLNGNSIIDIESYQTLEFHEADFIPTSSEKIMQGDISNEINSVLLWVSALSKIDEKKYVEATKFLESLDSLSSETQFNGKKKLIELYLNLKDFSKALSKIDEYLQFYPNNIEYLRFKELSLTGLSYHEQSISILNKLLKIDKSRTSIYLMQKANILLSQNKYEEALNSYQGLKSSFKNNDKQLLRLVNKKTAQCKSSLNDHFGAFQDLETALSLSATPIDSLIILMSLKANAEKIYTIPEITDSLKFKYLTIESDFSSMSADYANEGKFDLALKYLILSYKK